MLLVGKVPPKHFNEIPKEQQNATMGGQECCYYNNSTTGTYY